MKICHPNYLCICIPAYKELQLVNTLKSLSKCRISDSLEIHVFVVINGSEDQRRSDFDTNMFTYGMAIDFVQSDVSNIHWHISLEQQLPAKHAGVGLARRIAAGEAIKQMDEDNVNGVIVYLDADCTVAPNYFIEIASYFDQSKKVAVSIDFQHEVSDEQLDLPIIEYEVHLRYYIQMQRLIGLPFAIHTVGSSMAVLKDAYISKGGMNKRKAGEDFYFLQKFIKDGVCGELFSTTVFPSSRQSDRVPFGTGRAMLQYEDQDFTWFSYNPNAFYLIQSFIQGIDDYFQHDYTHVANLHEGMQAFLQTSKLIDKIRDLRDNVKTIEVFRKRFYQVFDAFQLMKCLHFLRHHGYSDWPIEACVRWYYETIDDKEMPEQWTEIMTDFQRYNRTWPALM